MDLDILAHVLPRRDMRYTKSIQIWNIGMNEKASYSADEVRARRATQRGARLSENPSTTIYALRACRTEIDSFTPMDYCYISHQILPAGTIRRAVDCFTENLPPPTAAARLLTKAIEHACTCAAYHDEPHHILIQRVAARDVYEATNPGEYFYDGDTAKGVVTINVSPEGLVEVILPERTPGLAPK